MNIDLFKKPFIKEKREIYSLQNKIDIAYSFNADETARQLQQLLTKKTMFLELKIIQNSNTYKKENKPPCAYRYE